MEALWTYPPSIMSAPKLSEEEFIRVFESGGAAAVAAASGLHDNSSVYKRRRAIEKRRGIQLFAPTIQEKRLAPKVEKKFRIANGHVLIGSDAHYWPGVISTAHLAFCDLARRLEPVAVILNGDVVDGASISRHPPLGWEGIPSLAEEFEAVKARLSEIEAASPASKRWWTFGNHDARFEMMLAKNMPQMKGIEGAHLKDHFPKWTPAMMVTINKDIVVKHRFKGGVHAAHNNTLWSGRTMITGHLHSAKVTPLDDYNGTRWGVDCGTLAEPYGEQFAYTEGNPVNWRSGFCVLTFYEGELLQPELALADKEGSYQFRGERHAVSL